MESLRSLIELVRHEKKIEEPEDVQRAREDAMTMLFEIYGGVGGRFEAWMISTADIPADKLVLAIAVIIRSHKWPNLPVPAEIHDVAREIAGLNLSQYRAGYYLPPPTDWPPHGKRFTVADGLLPLTLNGAQTLIGAGLDRPSLPESTE